jgi:hypothetical protein
MANYNSFGAYTATSVIPGFKGLMQYGDGIDADPRYAVQAYNMETPGGVLQPSAACVKLDPSLSGPIETLACLHRRWYTGDSDPDVFIAACAGKLYYMLTDGTQWTELAFPDGVTAYQSSVWSWVAYEINLEGSTAPVDVMLLSNAKDGMVMVRGDNFAVSAVNTPKKFGVISRYAERIWGGAIEEDPDMLVYSAPYDPTDWAANTEIPEDGAGDIQQPSWDGDSFTALCPFGSQLIAMKRTRVWRIIGTDPGEYVFKEQYGGGTPYANTVGVQGEQIFMLTPQGVALYDGLNVSPFQQESCKALFARINASALGQASGCVWRQRYYVALPIDSSPVNNAVLIYSMRDGTWLLRTDVTVEAFLPTENALYFTSSTTPGYVWRWEEDSWETGGSTEAACLWETPWNDLGAKHIQKGGFDVYLLGEVKTRPVTLTLTLQTEKKSKTKQYTIMPSAGTKSAKQKRLHFGGAGRRFKLRISAPVNSAPWRLVSGLQIISETDPD